MFYHKILLISKRVFEVNGRICIHLLGICCLLISVDSFN